MCASPTRPGMRSPMQSERWLGAWSKALSKQGEPGVAVTTAIRGRFVVKLNWLKAVFLLVVFAVTSRRRCSASACTAAILPILTSLFVRLERCASAISSCGRWARFDPYHVATSYIQSVRSLKAKSVCTHKHIFVITALYRDTCRKTFGNRIIFFSEQEIDHLIVLSSQTYWILLIKKILIFFF